MRSPSYPSHLAFLEKGRREEKDTGQILTIHQSAFISTKITPKNRTMTDELPTSLTLFPFLSSEANQNLQKYAAYPAVAAESAYGVCD